jgi:hypothetical protein
MPTVDNIQTSHAVPSHVLTVVNNASMFASDESEPEESFETKLEATGSNDSNMLEMLDCLHDSIKSLLKVCLTQCREALERNLLIRKYETFYRILLGVLGQFRDSSSYKLLIPFVITAWNDRIFFSELSSGDKWILRNANLDHSLLFHYYYLCQFTKTSSSHQFTGSPDRYRQLSI